jgi:hypothetical protein
MEFQGTEMGSNPHIHEVFCIMRLGISDVECD